MIRSPLSTLARLILQLLSHESPLSPHNPIPFGIRGRFLCLSLFCISENIKSCVNMPPIEMHIYCAQPCTILRDVWVSFTLREYSDSLLRVISENRGRFWAILWCQTFYFPVIHFCPTFNILFTTPESTWNNHKFCFDAILILLLRAILIRAPVSEHQPGVSIPLNMTSIVFLRVYVISK